MAGAIMDKVWGLFGGVDQGEAEEYDDDDVYEYEDKSSNYENEEEDRKFFGGKKGKVVPLNAQGQSVKMVISQPTTFEQSEEICSLLKEKKSVIVNLEYVNKDVARRIVDFISGGVYALDGHIQKISNSISDYFSYKEKDFTFINYDFYLYRKYNNKLTKIIDIIIFSILSIPTILLNLIIIICLNAIKIIKNKLFNLFKQLENKDKWNLIIKKSTNISIIIAFIIVYIIMVLFKEQFFPQIIDIFTFLSTVILLPLIYDSIKSNK